MFLELTEILVCPACRPAQGLVALVERMEGRRVMEGSLGCPACEARYPIRRGDVHFGGGPAEQGEAARESDAGRAAREPPAVDDARVTRRRGPGAGGAASLEEPALMLAALLGVQEGGGGVVLLGRGLAPVAAALAGLAETTEVLALAEATEVPALAEATEVPAPAEPRQEPADGGPGAGEGGSGRGAARTTALVGVAPAALPLFSGRLRGVALVGGVVDELTEGTRVLASRGRLVVLRPGAWVAERAGELGLEVLAAEDRALVAVRR